MNLTKGQRLTLDVTADSYGYYTVDCDGQMLKVKNLIFSATTRLPERLSCIVDKAEGSTIFLKQDMAPIFAARYTTGESYEFIVEKDMTMTGLPHYRVTQEGVGYLGAPPRQAGPEALPWRQGALSRGQDSRHQSKPAYRGGARPPRRASDGAGQAHRTAAHAGEEAYGALMEALAEEPRQLKAQQMLKSRNPEWVLEALRAGREHIFSSGRSPEASIVATLRSVAAYILEDSVLLGAFPAPRRISLREEIARLVSHCDDMLTALNIVAEGRQGEYISDMMACCRHRATSTGPRANCAR